MSDNFDFSEHKTGNLLIGVRRPVDTVTPAFLRTVLPFGVPVPFTLQKAGLNLPSGPTIVQLTVPPLVADLEFQNDVVTVEPERFVYLPPQRLKPVDKILKPTWGVKETKADVSAYRGRGVSVAVLDSGLDFQHPDFIDRVALIDRCDFTGTGIDDLKGHGTYCAGIACGPVHPSDHGRYGVAAEARLLIGKIFDVTQTRGPDFTVLSGILWAAVRGADIISLSWGTPIATGKRHSRVYEFVADLLLKATETIIVVSSGNASDRPLDLRPIYHPADCPSVIAVAGVYPETLEVARFSCGSVGGQRNPSLAGPGVDVVSSVPRRNRIPPYAEDDGTSAAAAFVAGIAALWAEESGARGEALRDLVVTKFKGLSDPVEYVGAGFTISP